MLTVYGLPPLSQLWLLLLKEAFELAVQGIQNTIEYTKDSQGNRIKVTIGYQEFKNLLIEMENVEDLLAYYVAIVKS